MSGHELARYEGQDYPPVQITNTLPAQPWHRRLGLRRTSGDPEVDKGLDRAVFRLALPSMIENFLVLTLILTDTLMIAMWGGAPAVAATAAAGHVLWRVSMTFGCVDRGTTALVARAIGEGNRSKADLALKQSLLQAITLGVVLTVLGWYGAPSLLSVLGTPAEVLPQAAPYLQLLFLGTVPRMVMAVSSAAIRGAGDTRTPMFVSLAMNGVNVVANAILIFGLPAVPGLGFGGWNGLGLVGCAIGTTLAQGFAAVALLTILSREKLPVGLSRADWKPHWRTQKSLGRISLPAAGEEMIMTIGFSCFFAFVALLGTEAMAAHTISTRVEALAFMPAFGFAVAASTLVGQSLGAANPKRAVEALRRCAWACTGFMALAGLTLILFGELVVRLFLSDNPEVEGLARTLLLMAAIQQPILGLVMILGGGLRGAGDTIRPMVSSLLGNLVVRVGVCYLLAFPLGFGIYGIYAGTLLDWLARGVVLTYFVNRGHWLNTKIR